MNVPEIGEGLVLGVGGSYYREAVCDAEGNLDHRAIIETPSSTEEFFRETGRRILSAADTDAHWAVIGIPGPVSTHIDAVGGQVTQRLRVTNIAALSRESGFDAQAEMTAIDPAVGRLLEPDSGFTLLVVNDGDLAAQAAARLYGTGGGERSYNHVADLIDGTGTGGAMARRDLRFPGSNLFHPDPGLWEVGHRPLQLGFPSRTFEETISGSALAEHSVKPLGELSKDNPLWDELAHGLGMLALDFALYGGAELVVLSGGTAIKAQSAYRDELERLLDRFASSQNPMHDKVPDVKFVPPHMCDTYELEGAFGAMTSHLMRRAIDALVLEA